MTRVFVTGATGFIGSSFVRAAVGAGYQVQALTRSEQRAVQLRAIGVEPVIGDLALPTDWPSRIAGADAVVHLAQPETYGARITAARARRFSEQRLAMDDLLLQAAAAGSAKRVIYVAGTSYYGDQGTELRDETAEPNPKGWGPYIAPAIERVREYAKNGLPLIKVFPGWVYGPGSWFAEYNLKPLSSGKAVTRLQGRSRTVSTVHVDDAAQAILHLLVFGQVGDRYFVVDDEPGPAIRISTLAADALGVPLRVRAVPQLFCTLFLGPIVTESLTCDARLSNAHLKETGFVFRFRTIDDGVPNAVGHWLTSGGKSQ
jgi:nucleoside-diphosphate-sugar epimerase